MEMTSPSPRSIHLHLQEKESSINNTTPSPQTPNKAQETNDNNPYPTTFVQADTSNFKQVVQLLTGSSSSTNNNSIPPIKSTPQKKQGFKLYERRNSLKNGFMMINTRSPHHQNPSFSSPRELLSPSILDFPSLVLSPTKSPLEGSSSPREDKAIAEKKFYLHLSPPRRTDNVEAPPQLLPLFPLTSPRSSKSQLRQCSE